MHEGFLNRRCGARHEKQDSFGFHRAHLFAGMISWCLPALLIELEKEWALGLYSICSIVFCRWWLIITASKCIPLKFKAIKLITFIQNISKRLNDFCVFLITSCLMTYFKLHWYNLTIKTSLHIHYFINGHRLQNN